MCLINFQFQEHPKYKLIVAANRDEAYNRPTAPAHFWENQPETLAGRDLSQMGTWLGITKHGRFAALTNFRHPDHMGTGEYSRGEIVANFLANDTPPFDYLSSLKLKRKNYTGFNVIAGDPDQLFYYSNVENKVTEVSNGTHGLSNHFLNTPWPKVVKGKNRLKKYAMEHEIIDEDVLFEIIADAEYAQDQELPETGIGLELERKLSPLFIKTPDYGTRSSTVLLIDRNNHVTFIERTYEKGNFKKENEKSFSFKIA
ncbi:hypothetical protein CIL03_18410 [Virgibacillus indicus]|uniref:NRDE family protein n=1 Tax=Virgibacillus indicus TaxID=2024554 RepID=A0A265N546_9BACI|nr:NRDE family protein [Virgibacillus indicus]OZU87158.1 hypothetical protein CIL03_18410 [Virgibacillus indicus]